MSIADNLNKLPDQEIQERNLVNSFLPFRQQRSNVAEYDFEAIAASVLSTALRRKIKKGNDLESYKSRIISRLTNKLTDDSLGDLIYEMYFSGNDLGLYKVSPEFLLFKESLADASNNKHVSQLLKNFIAESDRSFPPLRSAVNFLESELVSELQTGLEEYRPISFESPYLPFLSEFFAEDLQFLFQHPNYLLQNIRSFFGLYAFLYSAQLALNINGWKSEPESKPLFFILDTEKASLERKYVKEAFPQLKARVADLFPVLSMLEYLNQPQNKKAVKYPLWKIFNHIEGVGESERINVQRSMANFCDKYRKKRGLSKVEGYPRDIISMVHLLTETAKEIFSKRGTSQFTVNSKFVNAFENEIAQHFVQTRGRSGRVLTISQDYFLLLTNLAIGDREQLQFQELLSAFRKRGVWFDRQSELAIIKFLERIGNIEKMSDSGDAVYVQKTL
ncbi:DNA phosphorothioation-dependent restriction protein DptG [Halomonas heilongjiangensis]|uniref:DNA phosphorothioation-dependent restriction protein DptG n=1 Tax=Halomonas heilongjiangensis TaxID=1387883 RepID=A0A2N7TQE9_9GAMM|nr:DNA phosphorothioation-dependent restriction protein DptG [Halomonas heilongjiangensis]PMR70405.1 DNA phosphorothioation-dependent restriction protein DptG [Halomonas heilongjiangensis]PXX91365.1 DNA phosphorothioation-dependent restriction protein DptG [Halomonas heilongjiangensis]